MLEQKLYGVLAHASVGSVRAALRSRMYPMEWATDIAVVAASTVVSGVMRDGLSDYVEVAVAGAPVLHSGSLDFLSKNISYVDTTAASAPTVVSGLLKSVVINYTEAEVAVASAPTISSGILKVVVVPVNPVDLAVAGAPTISGGSMA